MTGMLDLPAELILRILWFLDLPDILSCQLSHKSLHAIIKGSTLLKYLSALRDAGMEDNRLCPAGSMSERLHMLNLQEDAWATHLIDFSQTIQIPGNLDRSSLPYCLSGGMYFFIELEGSHSNSLHYVVLPSITHDDVRWSRIDTDTHIVDLGFAIYEHDLFAVVTSPLDLYDGSRSTNVVKISFFKASTRTPYPFVDDLNVFVSDYSRIYIKIAGENLALMSRHDSVDVYEWKTGIQKVKIEASGASYSEFLFLTSKVLLLSNKENNTFELWDIPEFPQVEPITCPSGALGFPPIKQGSTIRDIRCRREAFFGPHGVQYSSFPFHPSSADAISIFDFSIQYLSHSASGRSVSDSLEFRMFVHNQSLLDIYPVFSLPPTQKESSATANVIPWDKWGPGVTRLLPLEAPFNSVSINQRYALIRDTKVIVLDFNPIRTRNLKAVFSEHTEGGQEDASHPLVITNEDLLDHICFENPVISKLPYTKHVFQHIGPSWASDDVAIDNERLIVLRRKRENQLSTTIEVFHIGQATPATLL